MNAYETKAYDPASSLKTLPVFRSTKPPGELTAPLSGSARNDQRWVLSAKVSDGTFMLVHVCWREVYV